MANKLSIDGTLIDHGGHVVAAADTIVTVDGVKVTMRGDRVICDIDGEQTVAQGSSIWKIQDRRVARVGDLTTCGAVIIAANCADFITDDAPPVDAD